MARSTAHPNHQCVSSNDIDGTEVYGADGNHIGEVDHMIIDKVSGRVAYVIIALRPKYCSAAIGRFLPLDDIVDRGQFGTTARSKLGDTVIPPLPNGRS